MMRKPRAAVHRSATRLRATLCDRSERLALAYQLIERGSEGPECPCSGCDRLRHLLRWPLPCCCGRRMPTRALKAPSVGKSAGGTFLTPQVAAPALAVIAAN